MIKKLFLVFCMCVISFGCTSNNNLTQKEDRNEEDNRLAQKELYYNFLTSNDIKGDEFALLDINGDEILDLIINDVCTYYTPEEDVVHNIFRIYSISHNEVVPIFFNSLEDPVFKPLYLSSQSMFEECYKDSTKKVTYTNYKTDKNEEFYYNIKMDMFGDELYLINKKWLSASIDENFVFWSFSSKPLKYKESSTRYDINNFIQFDKEIINQIHYLPVSCTLNTPFTDGTAWFFKPIYMVDDLTSLNYIDSDYELHIEKGEYAKLFYNYDENVKGENIDTIEKVEFYELNMTNYVKFLK
ncbi:MAG: hypothetical protein ACLSVX_13025 [Massilimicrobiota timonensis]